MASSAALGGVILALIEGVGIGIQRYMGAAMNDPMQAELENCLVWFFIFCFYLLVLKVIKLFIILQNIINKVSINFKIFCFLMNN